MKNILDFEKVKNFLEENDYDFSFDKNILDKFSEDTSLFKILPSFVVFPKTKIEISKLLYFLNKNKISITARSAGTDMSGGSIGDSIILSYTKYFNHIKKINKDNLLSEVEPGVYYRDFEKETLKHKLIFPSFPASREMCALGGMIANNSGGEKSLKYGKTEKYVKSLDCILSNGEIVNFSEIKKDYLLDKIINTKDEKYKKTLEFNIYKNIFNLLQDKNNQNVIEKNTPKVSKNSAGYYLWNFLKKWKEENIFDISKLIVGSQGTLALVSNIEISLVKNKEKSGMLLVFVKNLNSLKDIQNIVQKYNPESFESYDDNTFKVGMKFLPALIKKILNKNQKHEKNKNLLKIIFSFWKEIYLLATFGMPKLFLLIEFTSDDENEILFNISKCEKEIKENIKNIKTEKITKDFEKQKYWTMRRESFNLLREKVNGFHTAPFIDDICVKSQDLGDFVKELRKILNKYKLYYTIAGHVGDGNLHIIPLMNFDDKKQKEKNIETIKKCSKEVYSLVKKYNGSITAEHNDGLIRTPFLNDMFDIEMLDLFRQVKNIFDPNNILNPGKKVSINKDLDKEFENNLKYIKF